MVLVAGVALAGQGELPRPTNLAHIIVKISARNRFTPSIRGHGQAFAIATSPHDIGIVRNQLPHFRVAVSGQTLPTFAPVAGLVHVTIGRVAYAVVDKINIIRIKLRDRSIGQDPTCTSVVGIIYVVVSAQYVYQIVVDCGYGFNLKGGI